jgi:hypothetical protein
MVPSAVTYLYLGRTVNIMANQAIRASDARHYLRVPGDTAGGVVLVSRRRQPSAADKGSAFTCRRRVRVPAPAPQPAGQRPEVLALLVQVSFPAWALGACAASATYVWTRSGEASGDSANSRAVMAANAVHHSNRWLVSAPIAGASSLARAAIVSTSSACQSSRSMASNAKSSPRHGAGSIATSPRWAPPSRMLLGVRSPCRRAVGGTLLASRVASWRPRSYSSGGISSRSSGCRWYGLAPELKRYATRCSSGG